MLNQPVDIAMIKKNLFLCFMILATNNSLYANELSLNKLSKPTYDISGVKIGMSPDKARRVLNKNGYKIKTTSSYNGTKESIVYLRSYQQDIKGARREKVGKSNTVGIMEFFKKNDSIKLWFISMPEGAQVSSVKYYNNNIAITKDDFKTMVYKKYGEPHFSATKSWSALPLTDNKVNPIDKNSENLRFNYHMKSLELRQPRNKHLLRKKMIKDASIKGIKKDASF